MTLSAGSRMRARNIVVIICSDDDDDDDVVKLLIQTSSSVGSDTFFITAVLKAKIHYTNFPVTSP